MKKTILGFIGGLAVCLLLAFTVSNYDTKKSTGEVEQVEGIYIFYRCKPVTEYDYIGTYKIKLIWDDKPTLLFDKLVRKTKEKYPNAEAIIIDNGMGQCDAIKFK